MVRPLCGLFTRTQTTYEKYHAQGLEVVGVSLDDDKKAFTSFVHTRKMTWPQIYDGKGWKTAVASLYGVKAIPFMLVVGKDGKITALEPEGNLERAVKRALSTKP